VRIVTEVVEDEMSGPVRTLVGPVHTTLVVLGLERVDVADRIPTTTGIPSGEPLAGHDPDAPGQGVVAADLVVEAGVDGRRRHRVGVDRHHRRTDRQHDNEPGGDASWNGVTICAR
jgi:hypothetical protein